MRGTRCVLVTLGLVALSAALGACGGDAVDESRSEQDASETVDDDTPDASAPSTSDAEDADSDAADDGTEDTSAPDESTEPGGPAELPIEDGRHAAFLTDLDLGARTLTFDVIQFLTGQAAIDAYREDHPEDPEGDPDNDYYIRNVNPRLRTLPVASDVEVEVVRLGSPSGAGLVAWSWDDLPGHLAETSADDGSGRLSWSPWWLTVDDAEIVALTEQYIP
jgi:hypothetical protein